MNKFDTYHQFERKFCFEFRRSVLFEESKKEVFFTTTNAKIDTDILHTFPLDDKEAFTFTVLLDVLFKTNILKEKGLDPKYSHSIFIFYDNIDEFLFMTTFEF